MSVRGITWRSQRLGTQILSLAVFWGLLAGFLEAAVWMLLRQKAEWLTWPMMQRNVSAEILWVAPLLNLFYFLLLGALLALAASVLRRLPALRRVEWTTAAVFIFAALAVYPMLRVPDRLMRVAAILLALGVAVQAARSFRSRRPSWQTALPRGTVMLLALALAAFGSTRGADILRSSLAPAQASGPAPGLASPGLAAPGAIAPARMNVVLIVIDTLRADHLSSYGYSRPTTPHLDALAQRGVLFEYAFATSSWTPPSHASMLTGLTVEEHNTGGALPVLDQQFLTLPEYLAGNGYATAAFSANTLWVNQNSGFNQGFQRFEDYFHSAGDMVFRTVYGKEVIEKGLQWLGYRDVLGRKRAPDVNRSFLSWVDRQAGEPFFVLLNYFDVHAPYVSPEPYHTMFMDDAQRAVEKEENFAPPARASSKRGRLLVAGYDGALRYWDEEFGRLVDALESRGLLENTVIIVTSDHGEAFGEHGLYEHGHSLYRELIQVPLIVYLPGEQFAGTRVKDSVSLMNIPATVVELTRSRRGTFPGGSLQAHWNPAAPPVVEDDWLESDVAARKWLPKFLPVSHGAIQSFISGRWHLIVPQTGPPQLFDLIKDRKEATNLANSQFGRTLVALIRRQVQHVLP